MWFDIAAAKVDVANASISRLGRDNVAAKMTVDQIADAQGRAENWVPKMEANANSIPVVRWAFGLATAAWYRAFDNLGCADFPAKSALDVSSTSAPTGD